MKKITLILCFFVSLSGISQTYDFKTSQSAGIWTVGNGGTHEIVDAGLKMSWTSGQPKTITESLSVDTSTQKYMAITLNSTAQETINIQIRHRNVGDVNQRFFAAAVVLDGSFNAPRTFVVDMTHANWTGTMEEFDFVFKNSANTTIPTSGSVTIQKIEFLANLPSNNTYLFTSGTDTEGWSVTNGTTSVANGVLELTPSAAPSKPKIIQSNYRMLQSEVSYVHITYKNESALNNEMRITWTSSTGSNGGKQWTIPVSQTTYSTRSYSLGDNANQWNAGNEATNFTILVRQSSNSGNTGDAGKFNVKSVVFNNSATPPNMFEGTTDSDWATDTNWSLNEVPASGSSNPVNDVVTIPTGINAVIGSTTAAVVTDLTVDGGTLNITGGGSLIVSGTSTGNVTYNRTLTSKPANADGWHLVSSPVAGQTFNNDFATNNNLATSGTKRGFAFYNDALSAGSKYTYLLSDDTNASSFNSGIYSGSGVGYSAKIAATGTLAFTGTINTSDVNGVSISASATDFVLLGVPYTAYMSSADFLTANTNLDQSQIWVWEQGTTGGNFIASTAKGDNFIVAPGQGFFVKKSSTVATVNFAESNQASNADTFKKSSRTEVKLLVNNGEVDRFAKMYYVNNVTKGYDLGWEGETFGGIENKFDIFSHLVEGNQGKNYQVQSLPLSEMQSIIVPLGLRVDSEQEITFSTETLNLPTGIKVFLEDRLNNVFTRLDEANAKYTATVSETSTDGRFFLHTTESSLSVNDEFLNSVHIYKTDNATLRIVGLSEGNTSVKLYNVLGKQVMNSKFNATGVKELTLPKLSQGVYIVQLETETGKLNKKIVLE